MKFRKKGLVELAYIFGVAIYLAWLPALMTTYGREIQHSAFPLDVPWSESYSVLTLAWIAGHVAIGLLGWLLCSMFVKE